MALTVRTQKDVRRFLVALKRAIARNRLGVLSYERGPKNKSQRNSEFVYYGVFTGPIRLLESGGESYGTTSFKCSERDVDFAFATDRSGEVTCAKTGEGTEAHFRPRDWSATAHILIHQIQVFSRDCHRKLAKTAAQVTEEKISSLNSLT